MKRVLYLLIAIFLLSTSSCRAELKDNEVNETASMMVSDALNSIKDVHPGTAGCSLKAMYAIKDVMSLAGSNEYINVSMQKYMDSLSKEEKMNFSESVDFVKESFEEVDKNDPASTLKKQDINLDGLDFTKMNYDYAKNFFDVLSDLANRDYSND